MATIIIYIFFVSLLRTGVSFSLSPCGTKKNETSLCHLGFLPLKSQIARFPSLVYRKPSPRPLHSLFIGRSLSHACTLRIYRDLPRTCGLTLWPLPSKFHKFSQNWLCIFNFVHCFKWAQLFIIIFLFDNRATCAPTLRLYMLGYSTPCIFANLNFGVSYMCVNKLTIYGPICP